MKGNTSTRQQDLDTHTPIANFTREIRRVNVLFNVIKKGKVRRSKLYYLRKKVGKATKIKEQE